MFFAILEAIAISLFSKPGRNRLLHAPIPQQQPCSSRIRGTKSQANGDFSGVMND